MHDEHLKPVHHHIAQAISVEGLRHDLARVEGANAKVALLVTRVTGTMWAAYLFVALSLVSAPAALSSGSTLIIVSWVSQSFLQLVLLPILLVGQSLQNIAADKRSSQTFQDVVQILDRLDTHTEGGLTEVLEAVRARP